MMNDQSIGNSGDLLFHTKHRTLEDEIFEESNRVALAEGITLKNNGTRIKKDAFSPATLSILVDVGKDVGTGVTSAWLYDKIKDKDVTIETAKGKYENSKEGLEDALEDVIEQKK